MSERINVPSGSSHTQDWQKQLHAFQSVVTQLQEKLDKLNRAPLQAAYEDEACVYLSAEELHEFENSECQLHFAQDRSDIVGNDTLESLSDLSGLSSSSGAASKPVMLPTPSNLCSTAPTAPVVASMATKTHTNPQQCPQTSNDSNDTNDSNDSNQQFNMQQFDEKQQVMKKLDIDVESEDSDVYLRQVVKKRRIFHPPSPEVEAKRKECIAIKSNMQRNNLDLFAGLLFQPPCKFISYFVYQNKEATGLRQSSKCVVWRFQLKYRQLDGKEIYMNQESTDLEEVILKRRIWFMQEENQQLPVVQAARKSFDAFKKCQPSMNHLQQILDIVNKQYSESSL